MRNISLLKVACFKLYNDKIVTIECNPTRIGNSINFIGESATNKKTIISVTSVDELV